MKKALLGFVIGFMVASSFAAFATNTDIFTAQKATFGIEVNGEKFEGENPPVVIEGRTYLALRDTGEALGIEVSWNEKERQVEISKGQKKEQEQQKKEQEQQETEVTPEMPKQTTKPTKISQSAGEVFREVEYLRGDSYVEEIDGEQYITAGSFGQDCISRDGDEWYISIPGKEPILVKKGTEPIKNISESISGRIFVKLSVFGLEAETRGDKIILRYK